MSADFLTPEAKRENANTLAQALGIGVEDAARALDLTVLITADQSNETSRSIATELEALLKRTVQHVACEPPHEIICVEIVIGSVRPRSKSHVVYVGVNNVEATISSNSGPIECSDIPGVLQLLTACYASAAALYHATGRVLPISISEPFVIRFSDLGIDPKIISKPIHLNHAYLAGAGAIGNGFLWAARHFQFSGTIEVVDDDVVSSANLNRQIWFCVKDIGQPKAERLVAKAQSLLNGLELKPRVSRLQGLSEKSSGAWLDTLIVAVDSRRARRALQNEFPREIFDASTTDIREIVLHYNRQPTANACLSCIYEPDNEEVSREKHIAEHLGVSIELVRTERISLSAAEVIASRFPQLRATALVGTAYDSLFKQLCAESALRTVEGRRVLAPFAFVSVLAGTYLAIEIARRREGGAEAADNYWRLSPWHPPLARRRILRAKQPDCAFCANSLLAEVNQSLWPK